MKFLFSLFCMTIVTYFTQQTFAQNMSACSTSTVTAAQCGSSGVLIYTPGSSTATFAPPSATLSLGQLQITYSVTLDASNVSGFNYDPTKWGVVFGSPASTTNFYYQGSTTLATGVTVIANANGVSTSGLISAGTVVVTIDFTQANPNNTLSNDIISLITSGSLAIQPLYVAGSSNITASSLAFNWKADTGAMLFGPSISVQAQDSAFVVNLSPPSSLNAATPSPATGTATTLTSTTNSLSGYVIVYWLDTDANGNSTGCKANPGGWQFSMNPAAFASAPSSTPTTCTYTQYQPSFNTGGNSSAFGCPTITGFLPFDGTITAPALTADSLAIPYTPNISNPSQIPSGGMSVGCYYVVYVPSSQSSWSKGNINNGDIYGVVIWALNSAYPSPNYSLAHSNISYITGVNIPLASLDKSPNLPKTTSDCFVVTAASGNPNSQSVFYWRIIRDEYLTPMGITPFYYQHAKTWAKWLDEHPSLKPALNTFFEYSGKTIYHVAGYVKKSKELLNTFIRNLEDIWEQEAGAQELPITAPQTEQQVSEQTMEQPSLDSNKDLQKENKETEENEISNDSSHENPFQQPRYDIFITGGVLFPTTDKIYYDKYYSSQMTSHIEGGANYIFWFGNLGLSTGLLGRYLMNSNNGSVTVLGTQQPYTLNFYSMTAEALVGIRYRNPCWSYLQPGIFAGAGVTRFREEASTTGSSSASNKPVGVTNYSPIFEFGGNLDINLAPLFSVYPGELGYFLSDVSLRLSASYNINPTPALSSTGLFVQAGFVFLIN
jgi:hypothetical protein